MSDSVLTAPSAPMNCAVFLLMPRCTDRTTQIGKMIDSYLKSAVRMDDHAIHLLFSANRWEAAYAFPHLSLCPAF